MNEHWYVNKIHCKACTAAYNREYYAGHREERRRYDRTPRGRFALARAHAKHRGIDWCLTFEDWWALVVPNICTTRCGGSLAETGSGLDRIDPDGGYTADNVMACCGRCNAEKSIIDRDLINIRRRAPYPTQHQRRSRRDSTRRPTAHRAAKGDSKNEHLSNSTSPASSPVVAQQR